MKIISVALSIIAIMLVLLPAYAENTTIAIYNTAGQTRQSTTADVVGTPSGFTFTPIASNPGGSNTLYHNSGTSWLYLGGNARLNQMPKRYNKILTVSPSDTAADYSGSSAISSALTAASSLAPALVWVSPGTYAEQSLEIPDGVDLIGFSANTCIISMTSTNYVPTDARTSALIAVPYDSRVSNLTINNTRSSYPSVAIATGWGWTAGTTSAQSIYISNCILSGNSSDTIYMSGANTISVDNVNVYSGNVDTLTISGSATGTYTVTNSEFKTVGTRGNAIHMSEASTLYSYNNEYWCASASDTGAFWFVTGSNGTIYSINDTFYDGTTKGTLGHVINGVGSGTGWSLNVRNPSASDLNDPEIAALTVDADNFIGGDFDIGGDLTVGVDLDVTGNSTLTGGALSGTFTGNPILSGLPVIVGTLWFKNNTPGPGDAIWTSSDLGEDRWLRVDNANSQIQFAWDYSGAPGWDYYIKPTSNTELETDANWDCAELWTNDTKRIDGSGNTTNLTVPVDQLGTPSGDKSVNMGNSSFSWNWVAPSGQPTYDGAFEIQANGAFTGDLFHVHQHTGNPGTTDLAHFEAEDADVLGLRITVVAGSQALFVDSGEVDLDGGDVLINKSGVSSDVIVEGDTDAYLLHTDGGLDLVSMGAVAASGGAKLSITGTGYLIDMNRSTDNSFAPAMRFFKRRTTGNGQDGDTAFMILAYAENDAGEDTVEAEINFTQTDASDGTEDADMIVKLMLNGATRAEKLRLVSDGTLLPGGDGTQDLGSSSKRWQDIWATNGTIQTSSLSEKENVRDIITRSDIVDRLSAKVFQWDSTTTFGLKDRQEHFGFMADDLDAILRADGLDPECLGIIVYSEDTCEPIGIRYTELIPILWKSLSEERQLRQDLEIRVDDLEQRVLALEGK
jgi:hypothetical protein